MNRAGSGPTAEQYGVIELVSATGNIRMTDTYFTAPQGHLILRGEGLTSDIRSTIGALSVETRVDGPGADIIVREADSLTVLHGGFEPGGLYTAFGMIDIELAGSDSLLSLLSGKITTAAAGKPIRLIADDIDFASGEDTVVGTGELLIRSMSDVYNYRIGSGAETWSGDDLSGA